MNMIQHKYSVGGHWLVSQQLWSMNKAKANQLMLLILLDKYFPSILETNIEYIAGPVCVVKQSDSIRGENSASCLSEVSSPQQANIAWATEFVDGCYANVMQMMQDYEPLKYTCFYGGHTYGYWGKLA